MRNWIRYSIVFLLVLLTPTALAAAQGGSAVLTAEDGRVSVALSLPEGKTETITSLRLTLRVSAEKGTIKEPSFQFENAIKSAVKDADISKDADGSYLVDLIFSGKNDQDIFAGSEYAKLGNLLVTPAGEAYQVKVEVADTKEGIDGPAVKYVNAGGTDERIASLENRASVKLQYEPGVLKTNTAQKIKFGARTKKSSQNVIFEWGKCESASGYVIYENEGRLKGYQEIATVNGASVTAYSHKFQYASKHTFAIRAFWKNLDGSISYGPYSQDIKVTLFPDKVKKLSVKKKAKVTLSWKKTAGAKGYQIYASKKKKGKYKLLKTVKKAGTTKFTVKKPKSGKIYYKVRAYVNDDNGKKKYGEFSAIRS